MELNTDVVIIGGGPTGSTCASMLARKGIKAVLFEKEKFPRDHVGESLLPFGYRIFEELGVLEEMKKRYIRKPGVRFNSADGSQSSTWCFRHVIPDESYLSFHVVRADFDKLLLDNAARLGTEVFEGTRVTKVDMTDPAAVRVNARNKEGEDIVCHARFVVDASGQQTFLASQNKWKEPVEGLKQVAFSTHWTNPVYNDALREGTLEIVHLGGEKLGWIWVIPVAENRLSVGCVVDFKYMMSKRPNYMERHGKDWHTPFYLDEIMQSPVVKGFLSTAEMAQEVVINGDYSYYSNKKFGTNFALIGDASVFLDPIFASGVFMGMKSAKLIANALEHLLQSGDDTVLKESYQKIQGAYGMVEQLIRLFYDPNGINFEEGGITREMHYENFESAYVILHHLLAGDFFDRYEKYLEYINLLKDGKTLTRYRQTIELKHSSTRLHCAEKDVETATETT